jgi:hypothetical protein
MEYKPTDKESEIIRIMKSEKNSFTDGRVWVTDKVNYNMRDIVQKSRKNYLGVFDDKYDEVTGREKYFVPMTEDMVETIVKNIDMNQTDINIRATNPQGYGAANILRYLLKYYLRKNYFGELLNELIRLFCIDGTVVMKVLKNYDDELGKQTIRSRIIDRTNIIIDPSEDNIQKAGSVIERNILKISEAKEYPWENLDAIQPIQGISKLGFIENQQINTEVPYAEFYERWGDLPIGPDNKWVPAIAIVSNLDSHPVVHLVKENKDRIKPYEEARFRKIFGRWDGRGVGEICIPLNRYLNETVNLRINAARIAQLGLFKYRKGSGITRQMLKSLISGGAIPVTRMDDIAELRTPEIKQSSYEDEKNTYNWAQRTTGAWDVSRGEGLPASQPATTAVLQEKGAKSGFNLLQQNLGSFLERVMEKHIIPLMIENLKPEEVVNIVGSAEDLKMIDESYINSRTNKFIIEHLKQKGGKAKQIFPDPMFLETMKGIYKTGLQKLGKNRPIRELKNMLKKYQYNCDVFVTSESFNKAVVAKQLNDMLINYARVPGVNIDVTEVYKQILDLMGLGGERFIKQSQPMPMPQQVPQQKGTSQRRPKEETEMTGEATTMERSGR